jgi:lysophospholipase-2
MAGSYEAVRKIIRREASFIGSDKIILGGVSQGAALALPMFITSKIKLGGYMGLCGWMPLLDCSENAKPINYAALKALVSPEILGKPMMFEHSSGDDLVSEDIFSSMVKTVEGMGLDVHFTIHEHYGHCKFQTLRA